MAFFSAADTSKPKYPFLKEYLALSGKK